MIPVVALFRTFGKAVGVLWRSPSSRSLLTTTALVIGGGTWFYHSVEGLRWVDSLYFTVMTLTTVGYGDFAPTTDFGKIFTVVFVLLGIGLVVSLVAEVARAAVAARVEGPSE